MLANQCALDSALSLAAQNDESARGVMLLVAWIETIVR
jgi:hypothetical protein